MHPILIRAFGRSGTTLMMQLLNTSPDIFVPNEYPFESRFLSYFGKLSKLPFGSKNISSNSTLNDEAINSGVCDVMSVIPYELDTYVDKGRLRYRFLHALWRQFQLEIEHTTGKNYKYYGEKIALDIADDINRGIAGVKNLYIVRDPRGELCSIMAFNAKRGFNGFGWEDSDDVYSYAKKMLGSRKIFLATVANHLAGSESALVIKYEDLALNLETEVVRIAKWLGVNIDFSKVTGDISNYSSHMTHTSVSDSANSWVNKLPQSVSAMFQEELSEELDKYGYKLEGYVSNGC